MSNWEERLFFWFNQWADHNEFFNSALNAIFLPHFKTVPFMLAVWSLWFLPKTAEQRTEIRERLTAALLVTLPIIFVVRALANYMPFRYRPIHTEGLEIKMRDADSLVTLDGFSSMPSDHAAIWIGFAVAVLLIHRAAGIFLVLWAIAAVSLTRVVVGYHWPLDIVVGGLIGVGVTVVCYPLLLKLVRILRVIPFLEQREALAYPLLFLATFEIAVMYRLTRFVTLAIIE